MARGAKRKSTWYDAFLDVGIWILFVLLLIPAGAVGYVIGKDQANDEPATTEQAANPARARPRRPGSSPRPPSRPTS